MDSKTSHPLTDDVLHAWVDQQLNAADRASVAVYLAQQPAAQEKVAQWQQQREQLRGLHRQILDEPIPSPLTQAAQQTVAAWHTADRWSRWGGMAAAVVLSFGTGWLTHNAWQGPHNGGAMAKAAASNEFVRQASYAHTVYAPEVRHPVEVAATEQAHLVQWLSKRVGRPIKLPNLSAEGYALVGGRLLPSEAGARAQFMFQNSTGTRITLYLGAVGARTEGPDAQETAFRFATEGATHSFYWVDQGFGYALTGPMTREALMPLVQAVYQQL